MVISYGIFASIYCMSKVFIVAGGPSLRGFNFKCLKGYDCIVVNKAIFDVSCPKYFITIDHAFLGRAKARKVVANPKVKSYFVANYASGQLVNKRGKIFCKKTKRYYNLDEFDIVIESRRFDGLGFNWEDFRNGNCSGYCALQLAILLEYTEIYLLGLDLKVDGNNTHYHSGYGYSTARMTKNLNEYFNYFKTAIQDLPRRVKVVSCSKNSRLNRLIPYTPISGLL